MVSRKTQLYIGEMPIFEDMQDTEGRYVDMMGERFYRISHFDGMHPFFMSLVSSADHWLFVASTGGLTAGRVNADSALFPYETEDKIITHSDQTGSKSILRVSRNGQTYLWEPFSERYAGAYHRQRNLYKNVYGNKLIFEEINHDLQLTFRTGWVTGDRFGFIKDSWLVNDGDLGCRVELLDGLQNILPYGARNGLQNSFSNLLNAYKRHELEPESGLGIFALSSALSDRAEPSESLRATVAWHVGLEDVGHLLSSDQLEAFRFGHELLPEQDVVGCPGAYFVHTMLDLEPGQTRHWRIVADVNLDSAAIKDLIQLLLGDRQVLGEQIDEDVNRGSSGLIHYVAAADGLQMSGQSTTTAHHFANVLFNIMRGGIFANGYEIEKSDFIDFVATRNRVALAGHQPWFAELPEHLTIQDLYAFAAGAGTPDLIRLAHEYLPLTFSRRHGDPSRPWNAFSINLKNADGSPRLDYQGNWRDIFQNWEPLAYAFPAYVDGMIAKFLNATTADGYNPYRVTRAGIEWEKPDPDDPWANIGYWSDHQIIYLQKLLEIAERVRPGALESLWNEAVFAYADVPYRLRTYAEMLDDWNSTIEFDWPSEEATEAAVAEIGTDGRLMRDVTGSVLHVTMTEKLLVLLLAKLSNLVPEGGIWMNTQRPEWNDANNALAGKGLSVVTTAYLRRFITFWRAQLERTSSDSFPVNTAVATLFQEVGSTLQTYQEHLESGFSDATRRDMMDDLGAAITAYRSTIYASGLPQTTSVLSAREIADFLSLAQEFIDHTLRANLRADGLAHSYNILRIGPGEATVENLYLMLEGQVALLSSCILSPEEVIKLLHSMRQSELYRADLHTYMLYPNRKLPGFLQKNNIAPDLVAGSALVSALAEAGDGRLLVRDSAGVYHFNGSFHNEADVVRVLDVLASEPPYAELVKSERAAILELFERVFDHNAFTGRSGTFFAYEGLGSVYWHMVSKLLLAVQECYQQAEEEKADEDVRAALREAYFDIRQGLGFNKSPAEYGAFPTDPYSHTPYGGGARQPGMTGQVKEEILTRMGELGVSVENGELRFAPKLIQPEEFLRGGSEFTYVDLSGKLDVLAMPANSLAFSVCQTPVTYVRDGQAQIEVRYADGSVERIDGNVLNTTMSQHIFDRDGQITTLTVSLPA